MGEHAFGNEARHVVPVPKREMLVEFCYSHDYVIANTCFQQDPDKQVTYYELHATLVGPITPESFAMIDVLLAPANGLSRPRSCFGVTRATGLHADLDVIGSFCSTST